jgi:hypothetical protein
MKLQAERAKIEFGVAVIWPQEQLRLSALWELASGLPLILTLIYPLLNIQ